MRKYRLSQHFLKNPRLALMLIGHSNIKKRDLVVDIGAGSGVITVALAKRAREVWAVEPDAETARKLRENLTRQNIDNVRVIEKEFQDVILPDEPYKVFANPPFHIASEILYKVFGLENHDGEIVEVGDDARRPEAVYLILQKNLALKLILTERHYSSQVGKIINKEYATKIRYRLQKTDFTPPPAVETVLYEAKRRDPESKPGV